MIIHTTLNIGEFHTNHCEDFLVKEQISENRLLIAVMDGCTMGTESVFASILIGKILRKTAKTFYYQDFREKKDFTLNDLLRNSLEQVFEDLKQISNTLTLDKYELLSTLIIGIVDTQHKAAEILAIGDGLVVANSQKIEFEQDNQPDYIAYHLNESFDDWFNNQTQKVSISDLEDLSISTDGIFTFKDLSNKANQKTDDYFVDELLINNESIETKNYFFKKLSLISENYNHTLTDDLAVVRIVFYPFK